MYKHLFRYCCLIGAFVIPVFFLVQLDNRSKFPILLGGVVGITIAYVIGAIILHYRKKKRCLQADGQCERTRKEELKIDNKTKK